METFWQTSSGIAVVAAQLTRPLGIKNRDEAYTFALFRDCGVPYPPTFLFGVDPMTIPAHCATPQSRLMPAMRPTVGAVATQSGNMADWGRDITKGAAKVAVAAGKEVVEFDRSQASDDKPLVRDH